MLLIEPVSFVLRGTQKAREPGLPEVGSIYKSWICLTVSARAIELMSNHAIISFPILNSWNAHLP